MKNLMIHEATVQELFDEIKSRCMIAAMVVTLTPKDSEWKEKQDTSSCETIMGFHISNDIHRKTNDSDMLNLKNYVNRIVDLHT